MRVIDEKFKELVESGIGCVLIMAGSGSDDPHIEKIAKSLEKYHIPYEVRVCSAHKQAGELDGLIEEYNALFGRLGIVAVAGGNDALSGTASYLSRHIVVSCPPGPLNESTITNPHGSSNAYIARPDNVARFFAQLYSGINQRCRAALESEITQKIKGLKEDDKKLNKKYAERQGAKNADR